MPGLSKVIVLDPDARAGRQVALGFQREGVPAEAIAVADPAQVDAAWPEDWADAGLVVVGGTDGGALAVVRRLRSLVDDRRIDAPIVFAGRGVRRTDAEAAGADEVVLQPAYLRDVVTIGRLLRGQPLIRRSHLVGSLAETTGVLTLVRALAGLGRSAVLQLLRGLRRGEVRFYHGEVTSAQVGMIHGQAALHQLLLWTDARFDFRREDVVRRHQIPLDHGELFADAERFLSHIRDSSGRLSPSMVLEQDVERIAALGKQVPTQVHGVLRMFNGHAILADILEDSPYRIFETLRVTQLAFDLGLLRPTAGGSHRATWRAVLAIEEWLVGAPRDDGERITGEQVEIPRAVEDRPSGRTKKNARRRRKKRRLNTPLANAPLPDKRDIDWGSLIPRAVGAEVGPLSGVVPAWYASGEIVARAPQPSPEVVGRPAEVQSGAPSPAAPEPVSTTAADTAPQRSRTRTKGDTEPPKRPSRPRERLEAIVPGAAPGEPADAAEPAILGTPSDPAVPRPAFGGGNTDERQTAPMHALQSDNTPTVRMPSVEPPEERPSAELAAVMPPVIVELSAAELERVSGIERAAELERTEELERAAELERAGRISAQSEIAIAELSDGIIRQRIPTAETAPTPRPTPSAGIPIDDRPEDATGEIVSRPHLVPAAAAEPSILIADLAAVQGAVRAVASAQAAAPPSPDAAAPAHERAVAAVRSDAATAFSDLEEAFFRAGQEKATNAPVPHTFDDLDEGYRPASFWDRLLRRKPRKR